MRSVRALVATGAISDATNIYWDVRIPERVPTIEFRIADVCATINEAGDDGRLGARPGACLSRTGAAPRRPYPAARQELLRAAHWRAARFGLTADLIDLGAQRAVPGREHIQALLDFVRPGLEASATRTRFAPS
jgi:carboxylate-amine ligase